MYEVSSSSFLALLFVFEEQLFAVAYSVDKTNGNYASHWCQPLVVRVSSTGVAAFFCLSSLILWFSAAPGNCWSPAQKKGGGKLVSKKPDLRLEVARKAPPY